MKKLFLSAGLLLASYGVFAQNTPSQTMPSSSGNKRDTVNQTTPSQTVPNAGGAYNSGNKSDSVTTNSSNSSTDYNTNTNTGSTNRSTTTTKKSTSTYKASKGSGSNKMDKKNSSYESHTKKQHTTKRDSIK